ncbi:MAG: LLM class flavin-dependent oxidoreductase [Alphaproteobacteria bacterium]|nr:LLM class flavin-dependent oxidoreductase [Alphaproteobacteria bacterium]
MKFGLFYELPVPKPWHEDTESRLFHQALDQIELADRLGFDYVWEVEHHFLEEYSHSGAPEVFLAAVSQRTNSIRLGHGVTLTPPGYNHPARLAERVATLDLVSRGRVDWGTGESATLIEMDGFGIDREQKTRMWREGTEQAANMMAMTPYPGFEGEYFSMPCRNVVPKPVQKPHPPLWMGCSRRESILRAARAGVGALVFGFVEPDQAAEWVRDYYAIIKSDECVPIGHSVNANIAAVSSLSVHEDEQEAVRRGLDGFRFFGYSLAYYVSFGEHKPGRADIWGRFEPLREQMPDNAGRGGIGTPEQVRSHLEAYDKVGMDQMIFVQQHGKNRHEHICECLGLFASEIMPRFKAAEPEREARKAEELAPWIKAALARKPRMEMPADEDLPVIKSMARALEDAGQSPGNAYVDPTRGGGIPLPRQEPVAPPGDE